MVKKRPSSGLSQDERSALMKRASKGKSLIKGGDDFNKIMLKLMRENGYSKERARATAAKIMWSRLAKLKSQGKLHSGTNI